ILALQMEFVSREQLIDGMNSWVLEKETPLGEILRRKGYLGPADAELLEQMVARHIGKHGDVQRSLAGVTVDTPLLQELSRLTAAGIVASVAALRTVAGPTARAIVRESPPDSSMRYRRLREHARGGLGQVSVALDTELHREVALKEIQEPFADHPEARERFVREGEITGQLEHPGIVPVYGLGVHVNGRPYYAMRLIRGQSLQDFIGHFHATRWD